MGVKQKLDELDPPLRYGVIASAVVVGLILPLKVIPAIVGGGLIVGLILLMLVGPYWVPTFVAFSRKHPSRGGVFALNFFLGWTFIGWVIALVWALSDNKAGQASVVVNNHVMSTSPTNLVPPPVPVAPTPPELAVPPQAGQVTGTAQ
jgi:hypothetical protein